MKGKSDTAQQTLLVIAFWNEDPLDHMNGCIIMLS